jgi:predicted RNA-binding Zn ribbon-like protein
MDDPPFDLWEWLGEPLAVDFANTVRRRGSAYRDFLERGGDLAEWARREGQRVPRVGVAEADGRLDEVRGVRADVAAVLAATVAAEPLPRAAVERLNERVRSVPIVRRLDAASGTLGDVAAGPAGAVDELLARVAAATIDLAAAGPEARLGFCDAPSCGQFFVRARRDQRWCGPACGTRVRVARHAARHR